MFPKKFVVTAFLLGLILVTGFSRSAPAVAAPEAAANYPVLGLDGVDDYVAVPHNGALNPTGAFTVEAWVKPGNISGCQTIIGKNFTSSYWLGLCNGRIRFYGSGSASSEDGTTIIGAGAWTHVAVVYRGSGREYYINGELDYVGGAEPAPTTNSHPVWIGRDSSGCCSFYGRISNVRLWNVGRTQEEIRRTMHIALDESLPGLVANWRFAGDYHDNIGGFGGTANNGAFLPFDTPPPQPAAVPLDRFFNRLPLPRFAAGTAFVPDLNQVYLLGGQRSSSTLTSAIDVIDAATGGSTTLGALPGNRTEGAAVYVPTRDKIYFFGGRTTTSSGSVSDGIFAIDPLTGAAETLPAILPRAATRVNAVYHPDVDKVYLFGGYAPPDMLDTVLVFDPATETISPAGFSLPYPSNYFGAAYALGKIYLFGGRSGTMATAAIHEVTIEADGSGVIAPLGATLIKEMQGLQAAVDPATNLVYLASGSGQDQVWVFDPVTRETWATRIDFPGSTYDSSVIYSPTSRHLLLIGGETGGSETFRNVWRVPVGDGPLVPLGLWDFPLPVGAQVNAIDGDEGKVVVGTAGSGAFVYNSSGSRTQYNAASLGSASGVINDVSYDAGGDRLRIATADAGVRIIDSGTTTYNATQFGTNNVLSAESTGFYGTDTQGLFWRRFSPFPLPSGSYTWMNNFAGQQIHATALRQNGDLYVIANNDLKRLQYSLLGTPLETNYGARCALWSSSRRMDMAFSAGGDWWIVSPGEGEFGGAGICRIPAAATPGTGGTVSSLLGSQAYRIARDADGRLWVAIGYDNSSTGGLAAYGSTTYASNSQLRGSDFNWMNGPLGRLNFQDGTGGGAFWDSSVTAVGAADERVWSGNRDGRLVTLAQRWQQLDDPNDIGSKIIQDVWTVRGRAFLATSTSLHVLQPDGRTWDNLTGVKVWDVLGDRQGRIWVATNTGLRLYTPGGWDYLADKEGTRPATAVYSLAEDHAGRIWIGGLHGLTLFDRERFVATFTTANSGVPATKIRTLFVDSDNMLWAGTDVGLGRLDGATWTVFTTADGLPGNAVFDLDQTGPGQIAISTSAGLSFYDGTTFATQSLPIPAANLPLSADESGRLWAGNAVYDGSRWEVYYTTDSGLASEEISGSAADGADRIWFSHAPDPGVSIRGTYLPPLANVIPVVSGVSPQTGRAGDILVIQGSGFGTSRHDLTVTVGRAPVQIISVTDTQIEVRLTENNSSGDVSVQIGERRSTAANSFCAIPTIDRVTPTGGNIGVVVNVFGKNLDPTATVYLDGTRAHTPFIRGATQLGTMIEAGDGSGNVRVVNRCGIGSIPAATVTATSSELFRRIALNLEQIVLNQGIESAGLVAGRPTLFQHYISHSVVPRESDALEIDTVELTFSEPGRAPFTIRQNYEAAVPTSNGAPSPALLRDIINSVNVYTAPAVQGSGSRSDQVAVQAVLKKRGQVVATGTVSRHFRENHTIRVLLVPLTDNTPTDAERNAIRSMTNSGLDNLRRRIFPTGNVEFYWSPISYTADDLLIFDNSTVDAGSVTELYDASHNLERARRWWNDHRDPDVMIAFGVMDPAINSSSGVAGQAFWPDISQMLNAAGLSALDTLCDIGGRTLQVLTFGLAGGGCDLEVPLYVGWGISTNDSADLIGHEMGHIMGLVKPYALNGSLTDNFSHSVNDEINGGECSTLTSMGSSASYNVNKSYYRQPGVSEPVVNTLTEMQIRPNLNVTSTWNFTSPTFTVTSEALTWRAKALMSYACNRDRNNAFFEPVDLPSILAEYGISDARTLFEGLTPDAAADGYLRTAGPTPLPVIGDRLYVSGVVNPTAGTGALQLVERLGERAPLDASYNTGTWLVQYNGSTELSRTGVFPLYRTSAGVTETGFFAATVLAQPGVNRIELRQGEQLLDSFAAGGSAPVVTLSAPTGGSYASGSVPVTWNAADGDGDALSITILYSADNGSTWAPVGFSAVAAGTKAIPVDMLSGSSSGRMKVVASDGFHSGEAISAPFTVAAQPPLPYIGAPLDGAVVLESQAISLSGGATDNQDLVLSAAQLTWTSDRDGLLGSGESLPVFLSVGTHVITLRAENSLGMSATAAVTVTVRGDYDADGIPDAEELTDGLNLLTARDARSDGDGDGLPLVMERRRGLNPGEADSDGDGRNDGDELRDGTDPAVSDPTLPADALSAFPASLTFDVDLSQDNPVPQELLTVFSREQVTWTMSADQPWLRGTAQTGATPDGTTILIDTEKLSGDGTFTGSLFFDSSLGRVTVPVTINAVNVPGRGFTIFLPVVIR